MEYAQRIISSGNCEHLQHCFSTTTQHGLSIPKSSVYLHSSAKMIISTSTKENIFIAQGPSPRLTQKSKQWQVTGYKITIKKALADFLI